MQAGMSMPAMAASIKKRTQIQSVPSMVFGKRGELRRWKGSGYFLFCGFAIFTQAAECELAGFHLAAGSGFYKTAQRLGNLDLVQINYCIALRADKVNMGGGIGIESFGPPNGSHTLNNAL